MERILLEKFIASLCSLIIFAADI